MSRIGRQPVALPAEVEASLEAGVVVVKGPKGELREKLQPGFKVKVDDGFITIERPSNQKADKALHGLYRSLIQNMVTGVHRGFTRKLLIDGVGFNAKTADSRNLTLNIGFCHEVAVKAPEGVEVECPTPTSIVVKGIDKQQVGQLAANIRRVRPPEPYKGKGIRYEDEHVRRKAGKAVGGK